MGILDSILGKMGDDKKEPEKVAAPTPAPEPDDTTAEPETPQQKKGYSDLEKAILEQSGIIAKGFWFSRDNKMVKKEEVEKTLSASPTLVIVKKLDIIDKKLDTTIDVLTSMKKTIDEQFRWQKKRSEDLLLQRREDEIEKRQKGSLVRDVEKKDDKSSGGILSGIVGLLGILGSFLKTFLVKFFTNFIVRGVYSILSRMLTSLVTSALSFIKQGIKLALEFAGKIFMSMLRGAAQLVATIFKGIIQSIPGILRGAATLLQSVMSGVTTFVASGAAGVTALGAITLGAAGATAYYGYKVQEATPESIPDELDDKPGYEYLKDVVNVQPRDYLVPSGTFYDDPKAIDQLIQAFPNRLPPEDRAKFEADLKAATVDKTGEEKMVALKKVIDEYIAKIAQDVKSGKSRASGFSVEQQRVQQVQAATQQEMGRETITTKAESAPRYGKSTTPEAYMKKGGGGVNAFKKDIARARAGNAEAKQRLREAGYVEPVDGTPTPPPAGPYAAPGSAANVTPPAAPSATIVDTIPPPPPPDAPGGVPSPTCGLDDIDMSCVFHDPNQPLLGVPAGP